MFEINDNVCLKSKLYSKGVIVDKKKVGSDIYYTIRINNQDEIYEESQLEKIEFKYSSIEDKAKNCVYTPFKEFNQRYLLAKVHYNLSGIFFESISSAADFLPHQFRPLMKILDSDSGRLLIADEVGVGKTIESGYIVSELLARNEIHSILVICPKNLIPKWIFEMKKFFNEDFQVVDNTRDLYFKFQNRGKFPKLVVGLELIRRKEIVNQLAQGLINQDGLSLQDFEPFNLLIFDEAHHLRNTETLSNKLAKILLEDCEIALFLTATPINTSLNDLLNLLNLLVYQNQLTLNEFNEIIEPNQILIKIQILLDDQPHNYINLIKKELQNLKNGNSFSHLIFERIQNDGNLFNYIENPNSRTSEMHAKLRSHLEKINLFSNILNNTRKRDIADHERYFPIRHPEHPVLVEFTGNELEFYLKARNFFIQLIIRRAEGFVPIQLVEIMPQRVIASSIQGTFVKLRKMLETHELEVKFEDQDFEEETRDNRVILNESEIIQINELLEFENIIGPTDSKFDSVLERIHQYFLAGNNQIIIFSYFKSTIDYLAKKLNQTDFKKEEEMFGYKIRTDFIHGDIDFEMRRIIFEKFENNEIQILVLSEIGAEGIDLQFCNCLINYDLPWNPMKLEQRIGRLDRYGQQKPIYITNVYIKNSIEDRILHRLYKRIKIVRENLMFLNPVLEEYFKLRKEILYQPEKTEEELEAIVSKIEENLISKKLDIENIEQRLDELKGNTSKALIHEERFIRDKSNPFTLKELFEALNYLMGIIFPDCSFETCENNEDIIKHLNKYKIPLSPTLYWLKTSETFIRQLTEIELEPESLKEQLNNFMYLIEKSKNPKKRIYKPILITYDVELGNQFQKHIHLFSLKHILAKILLRQLSTKNLLQLSIVSFIQLKIQFPYKSLLLRIYLLKIDALQISTQIKIIGYDFQNEYILSQDEATQVFNKLSLINFNDGDKMTLDSEDIDKGFELCFSEIIKIKQTINNKLRIRFEEDYKYKKEQIMRRFNNKIANLRQTLSKSRNPRVRRLYEGQIAKNHKRREAALSELHDKYRKSINISIIDIGAIFISN